MAAKNALNRRLPYNPGDRRRFPDRQASLKMARMSVADGVSVTARKFTWAASIIASRQIREPDPGPVQRRANELDACPFEGQLYLLQRL